MNICRYIYIYNIDVHNLLKETYVDEYIVFRDTVSYVLTALGPIQALGRLSKATWTAVMRATISPLLLQVFVKGEILSSCLESCANSPNESNASILEPSVIRQSARNCERVRFQSL